MKRRWPAYGLIGLVGVAAWWVYQNYEFHGTLSEFTVRRRAGTGWVRTLAPAPPVKRDANTIRIATFNIEVFGETKLADPVVVKRLAAIVQRFDIVAVQEIRAQRADLIPRFLEQVNAGGHHYHYVLGPRLGRSDSKEQYAYLYNRASIEVDPSSVYTINDPDDLLHREPLVASFRVRGPPADRAFTFSLVNIHVDPDEVAREMNVLDDTYRAVQRDGRGEDDIILLGDFNADDRHFGQLGGISQVTLAVTGGAPTNTRRNAMLDNLVFAAHATTEFTGQAGVFDVQHEYSLSAAEALALSDHFPVWAEFSVLEGGTHDRVVQQDVERMQR